MEDKPSKTMKSFAFNGFLKWTGGRTWDFSGETTSMINGAPPKMFRGEDGKFTPEDLLLASVNTCMLATFTTYAAKSDFNFISYESKIEGLLEHTDERGYIFTRITIKPKITVQNREDEKTVLELMEKAHHDCWMSNSVRADVIVEPEIVVD